MNLINNFELFHEYYRKLFYRIYYHPITYKLRRSNIRQLIGSVLIFIRNRIYNNMQL